MPRFTKQEVDTLLRLYAEGLKRREIGEVLGRSEDVIASQIKYLRKQGRNIPYRSVPAENPVRGGSKRRYTKSGVPPRKCNICKNTFTPFTQFIRFCNSCRGSRVSRDFRTDENWARF